MQKKAQSYKNLHFWLKIIFSLFVTTINGESDFSPEFLKSLSTKNKPKNNFRTQEGTLEHDWDSIKEVQQSSPSKQAARQYELYLKTEYELANQRLKKADCVSQLLMDSNPPLPAHLARARLLFESGKFFELIKMPFFSKIEESKDWETILMGARTYEMVGMLTKAEKLFDKAMENHADKEQVVYHRIMNAIKASNTTKAEKIIDQFLKTSTPKARHSIFYQLKAAINMQEISPNLEQALQSINKSLELNQRSEKALRIKLLILEQMRKNKKEIDYQDLIQTYKLACTITEDKNLKKALINRLFKIGRYSEAFEELKEISDKTEESYFDLALLALKTQNLKNALFYAQKAIDLNKASVKAKMLKLEILIEQKSENAQKFALSWFAEKKNRSAERKALLHLMKNGIMSDEIVSALENDFKTCPKNIEAIACMADAYMMIKKYEEAYKLYSKLEPVIDSSFADMQLKAKLIYSVAISAYLSGQRELSLSKLEKFIKLGAIYPEIYNLIAMIKLHEKDKINALQAIFYSKKAISENPTDVHFLRTLIFALIKAGKLTQANYVTFSANTLDPFLKTENSSFSWVDPSFIKKQRAPSKTQISKQNSVL